MDLVGTVDGCDAIIGKSARYVMPHPLSHDILLPCLCVLPLFLFFLLPILLPHYFHFIFSYFILFRSPFIVFNYFLLCSFPVHHFFIFQLFLNVIVLLLFYLAVDDMVDTAGTLCKAAEVLKEFGARRVFAFASHGVFSGTAYIPYCFLPTYLTACLPCRLPSLPPVFFTSSLPAFVPFFT